MAGAQSIRERIDGMGEAVRRQFRTGVKHFIFLALAFAAAIVIGIADRRFDLNLPTDLSLSAAFLVALVPFLYFWFVRPRRRRIRLQDSAIEHFRKSLYGARLPDGTATDFDPKWPVRDVNGALAIDPNRRLIRIVGRLGETDIDQLLPLKGIVRVEATGIDGASGATDRERTTFLLKRPKLVLHLSDGTKSNKMTIRFTRHEHDAARGWYETIRLAVKDQSGSREQAGETSRRQAGVI